MRASRRAPLLAVEGLTIAFGDGPVVSEVSFELASAGRLGLIGESGSGKSLTALAVLGLLPENARVQGSVRWGGRELLGAPESVLTRLRGNDIAMVFQEPMTALDPTMKVGRQVAEVIRLHDRRVERSRAVSGSVAGARGRTVAMLDRVGLPDPARIAESFPHQLSGGQRQRVVLAMALVNRPDLVICDEPTTALDVTVQARVLRLLDEVLTEQEAACLFISHDLAVVAQVCTDVVVLRDGVVVETGPVAQVLGAPQHPYTAGLVATARLDRVEPGTRLPTLDDPSTGSGRRFEGAR